MRNKFFITFAGAVGSSKTPIAYYLSHKLNLPILNNDSIRTEVIEDTGSLDVKEYEKRRDIRAEDVAKRGSSFIWDAGIDREWVNLKKNVESFGYQTFIISLNLSKELLTSLYNRKGYSESLARIDDLITGHNTFLENYANEVNLHINDESFANRLELSYEKARDWLRE